MNITERTGKKEIGKVELAVGKARKAIIRHIPDSTERKKLEQLCFFPSERTPIFSSTHGSFRPTLRSRHLILCQNVPTR